MLCDWLVDPGRKFTRETMSNLVQYLKDIHVSQDDSVYQDDLKEIYDRIIEFAD